MFVVSFFKGLLFIALLLIYTESNSYDWIKPISNSSPSSISLNISCANFLTFF